MGYEDACCLLLLLGHNITIGAMGLWEIGTGHKWYNRLLDDEHVAVILSRESQLPPN